MKKNILIFLALSFPVYAFSVEDCEVNTGILGKKCLTDEMGKDDLQMLIGSPDALRKFCDSCKSEVNINLLKSNDGKAEKASAYGKATLDEFQKEITSISLDLMKARSSFKLDFDPSAAIKSCKFDNLKKPTCKLTEQQTKLFEDQKKSIQNATATELANILSGSEKPEGLLTRSVRDNQCSISDKEALYSHTRFIEESMTAELMSALKNLKIPSNKNVASFVADKKLSSKFIKEIDVLQQHPIFQALLKDSHKLNNFLSSINQDDSNQRIIEKLYDSKYASQYGDMIKERCEKSFKKTSDILQTIYCEKSPSYIADDIKSMEVVSGSTFESMSDEKAELQLQTFCAHLSLADKKALSFNEIGKVINAGNNQATVNAPLADFKVNTYNFVFNETKINICKAINRTPPCAKDSSEYSCKLLKYSDLMKTSKIHKDLANSSNDNINLILRSIVGDGLPQKDGKVDASAVTLLKDEGILPGGDVSTRTSQPTVAAFNKTVNSQQSQPQIQAAKPTPLAAPAKAEPEAQASYSQSTAGNYQDDEESSSASPSHESVKTKSNSKPNSKFSNLSDDEQKRIMDMMKRSKKAGGKTPSTAATEEHEAESSAFPTSGNSMAGLASQVADSGQTIANTASKAAPAGSAAGKKATLDPTKKSSSFNDAIVEANANRQPASSGGSSGAQVSLSKTAANENEIKIKVADAELTQVNEFKEKLKVLLNAHSQEISVAGAGEKFVVKLNNFEINVVYNKELGSYEALCKDSSIPRDYLKTISNYFNVTLKGSSGKREALVNTLKQ